MRYAIFTDIHANLEALEAVLAKIDEIAQEEPIDAIWFLGDLVGYGPNPNECITMLRERTDVIIAGNHDWAAVGKIDLEDFSEAARISAEWTPAKLTDEHREFLTNLPERIDMPDCQLVHGSPYGPLWEYLTSEILAERSFQHFHTRYCLVGHTHVPVIFQQVDTFADTPTVPLKALEQNGTLNAQEDKEGDQADHDLDNDDEATEFAAIKSALHASKAESQADSAAMKADPLQAAAELADAQATIQQHLNDDAPALLDEAMKSSENAPPAATPSTEDGEETAAVDTEVTEGASENASAGPEDEHEDEEETTQSQQEVSTTPEEVIFSAEDRINQEIEELLTLLGLSQSMVKVTNEMIIPPIGEWRPPDNYRAIINPGGVGQPRDGDPRAAFMIYDTERGFTFYRVPYDFEKTQEKIIKAQLPQYLATRLAYGR